jgi:lysyl-tRNA synthetase class 2
MTERTEQEQVRLAKLATMQEEGFRYPNGVKRSGFSTEVLASPLIEPPEHGERHTVAGRVVLMRQMGKASFCHILDMKGKIQLYLRQDSIGDEQYRTVKELDIGDIVEARGYLFVTKTGEKTLHVDSFRPLVKCLVPPPEKWHGLTDVEARYRHRHLDLISHPEVRDIFRKRAQIIRHIRSFLDDRDFLEVETPVLQSVAGGTIARPFVTHHNSLSIDMFMRIALELPLKKLVVGGLERVYEIGRCFRNEGLSKKHNPEFTMIELYEAFATFEDHMDLIEELLAGLVKTIRGGDSLIYQERSISFARPFKRYSMHGSLYEVGGIPGSEDVWDLATLQRIASHHHIALADATDWGKVLEALWGALVEPRLVDPVFITHHPASISPLARRSDTNPLLCDRYELVVAGMEVANGYSELNDPIDQRNRFEEQAARKAAGDNEAFDLDEDYLRALESGLPPTAGDGIGIDRLTMLLCDAASIREVLLFPQMKPEGGSTLQAAEDS